MKAFLLLFSPISRLVCRIKDDLYAKGNLKPGKAPLPVVSVGNISFGGSEKTPLAMELIARLLHRGWRPALVSRGYRGEWEREGGVLSDGTGPKGTWRQGGDEPYMVARRYPAAGVFVGRDRLASCRKAHELGFTAVVLDDAFQHRRLERDLDIVLFDPRKKLALREGISSLRRAGIILVKDSAPPGTMGSLKASFPGAVVFDYRTTPKAFVSLLDGETRPPDSFRGKSVLAFCGIANPSRFSNLLRELGAVVRGSLTFPDHHPYPAASLEKIARSFAASGAEAAITTEKDAVKIAPAGTALERIPLHALRVGLDIEAGFYDLVEAGLKKAAAGKEDRA
ncbi:MAG: tetraacyldisaccharide 4'-kinase [Candidatus Aminicenantes bacterium]|nr:tetraacyldisaccharide 4'-kinase [Candidatus Aminicenantes bacterium]